MTQLLWIISANAYLQLGSAATTTSTTTTYHSCTQQTVNILLFSMPQYLLISIFSNWRFLLQSPLSSLSHFSYAITIYPEKLRVLSFGFLMLDFVQAWSEKGSHLRPRSTRLHATWSGFVWWSFWYWMCRIHKWCSPSF